VIDNFETALTRGNKKSGIIVAISFGKGAYEEIAARSKLVHFSRFRPALNMTQQDQRTLAAGAFR
jgi:hypothetical protein